MTRAHSDMVAPVVMTSSMAMALRSAMGAGSTTLDAPRTFCNQSEGRKTVKKLPNSSLRGPAETARPLTHCTWRIRVSVSRLLKTTLQSRCYSDPRRSPSDLQLGESTKTIYYRYSKARAQCWMGYGSLLSSIFQQCWRIAIRLPCCTRSSSAASNNHIHYVFNEVRIVPQIHPWLALGVFAFTAATDAVYVLFNVAVSSRRRLSAATWSSVWYLLSAFAVISYTRNWVYVCFAAAGSWVGAYFSMTPLRRPSKESDLNPPGPQAPTLS